MNRTCKLLCAALVAIAGCAAPDEATGETSQAASAASTTSRWPSSTIHYWIDTPGNVAGKASQPHCSSTTGGIADAGTIQSIHDAIAAYEAQTPIRFVAETTRPTSNPGHAVLIFTADSVAGASHSGGQPAVTASDWQGCEFLTPGAKGMNTIIHETGHQIGLQHEQRRSDYCGTIDIDLECVDADLHDGSGTEPFATNAHSQLLTPYDIHSIMQYSNDGDCNCRRADHSCKHPPMMVQGCTNELGDCALGGSDNLSPDDINAIYRMYEPSMGSDEVGDHLGYAMASGDFDGDGYDDLAVGAPGEAPGSQAKTGVVMLYKGTEGGLVAWKILYESDFVSLGATVTDGDLFGAAIAAGRYFSHTNALVQDLIIGAPGANGGAGAAYVYKGQGVDGSRQPIATQYFQDPSPSSGANKFGSSVAMGYLGGSYAIAVGAPNAAKFTTRNGMAFFRHAGDGAWTSFSSDPGHIITPPAGTNYGGSLSIDSTLAIGAPGNASIAGTVWTYNASLVYTGTLAAPTPTAGDAFGTALASGIVAFGQDRLVVGAPNGGTGGFIALYDRSTTPYTRTQTFSEASIPGMAREVGDRFGASLAVADMDGDLIGDIAIGAPGENSGQGVVAFVHGSDLTGWTWRGEKDDGFPLGNGDSYGTAVALGFFGDIWDDVNDRNDPAADVAVGAPFRDPNGQSNAGTFQEFLGNINSGPTFQLGFDEARVNGIQPRRASAPPTLSCPLIH